MSAGSTGGIGPVSVRYAAQIRELLHKQAMQRLQAERERVQTAAEAEKQARLQSDHKTPEDAQLKTAPEAEPHASGGASQPRDAANAAAAPRPVAQLVDIQA